MTTPIGVITAGTSDLGVAEEAALTAEFYGSPVHRINDVGVAGIHRLFARLEEIKTCRALVVVAGMEGALPSVVGGLVAKPVIAVPTSVGYGASFNGLAALLGMLNSCASGVSVVNIDNGLWRRFSSAPDQSTMNTATVLPDSLAEKHESIRSSIKSMERVIVAFSGGVDSSLVAHIANQVLGENALAVTSASSSLKRSDLQLTKDLAEKVGSTS